MHGLYIDTKYDLLLFIMHECKLFCTKSINIFVAILLANDGKEKRS